MAKQKELKGAGWKAFVVILLVLMAFAFMISAIFSLIFSGDDFSDNFGNVALIPVHGSIAIGTSTSLTSSNGASSTAIVKKIEDANEDPSILAIVLDINSGGGAPVASKEILDAVKRSNKTTVAWIREIGASGAYWIASGSDHIVADELSIVGSIGVNAAYLEIAGLLERYNITYRSLTKGKYKDMLSPFKELTDEEKEVFDKELTLLYEFFKDDVASNRDIPPEVKDEISEGQIFLGLEAKGLGLIDEHGGKPQVTAYLEQELNESVDYKEYIDKVSFLDLLSSLSYGNSYEMGRGIGTALKDDGTIFTT